MLKSFKAPRLQTTLNGDQGIILNLKPLSFGNTILVSTKEKTVNGAKVQYQAYTILGEVAGSNGAEKRVNGSLGHLTSGGFTKVVIKNDEGATIDVADLDALERGPVNDATGKPITGLFKVLGATATVTITSEEPQNFIFVKSSNGAAIYTVITSAEKATVSEFDQMMAEINGSTVSQMDEALEG